jgi:nucleoside 2-deoxyribosyltransferase
VFLQDLTALRACDAVVINLDGRAVDEGAAFELGFAYALGKRCVGYRTDVRVLLPWGLNPMVTVPLIETFTSTETLENWARELQCESENLRLSPKTISHSSRFRPGMDRDKLGQLGDELEAGGFAEKGHDHARRKRPRSRAQR